MKHINVGIFLLAVTAGISGCNTMTDCVIECEMGVRNHVLAQKAWGHWSWCYGDLDYPMHFAKGFKAGYRDVLDGGPGCQPTLPPKCYWKPAYQTPVGRCKINSWFDGFSHGALAASQDGYSSMGEIPISPTARLNIEMAQMPPDDQMYYQSYPDSTGQIVLPGVEQLIEAPEAATEATDGAGVIEGILPPALDGTEGPAAGNQTVPKRPYE